MVQGPTRRGRGRSDWNRAFGHHRRWAYEVIGVLPQLLKPQLAILRCVLPEIAAREDIESRLAESALTEEVSARCSQGILCRAPLF